MSQLTARVFSGEINPGQLVIVREILTADGAGDIDTARFSGARAEYDMVRNTNGTFTVTHVDGTQLDGSDTLRNIELLRFTDQVVDLTAGLRVDLHAFDLVTTLVSHYADNFDVQWFHEQLRAPRHLEPHRGSKPTTGAIRSAAGRSRRTSAARARCASSPGTGPRSRAP